MSHDLQSILDIPLSIGRNGRKLLSSTSTPAPSSSYVNAEATLDPDRLIILTVVALLCLLLFVIFLNPLLRCLLRRCRRRMVLDSSDGVGNPGLKKAAMKALPIIVYTATSKTYISTDYDHISDLIQTGQINVVVAPKNNEWGFDYWLAGCLEGKQTILESVIDDENIEFPTRSMVIKGQYLTLAAQQKRKGGYVYQDYKLGAMVYHFTNLVVGINIKLCTISNKNRSHV